MTALMSRIVESASEKEEREWARRWLGWAGERGEGTGCSCAGPTGEEGKEGKRGCACGLGLWWPKRGREKGEVNGEGRGNEPGLLFHFPKSFSLS
jgi:hypothetical protein